MDQKAINVIKNLAIDMLQNSGTGHPGITMSSAPILYTLFTKHIRVNTALVDWINRDRFILSAAHASELLYSTMFLCGYPLVIDDLKNYRKFDSKTPGHPEIKTSGVDLSTGFSGEGLATSVGIALAEKILAEKYNYKSKGFFDKNKLPKLFDYYTYVLVSDGDLMEGVSYEAASFAGAYELGKLIVLYDSNDISESGNIKNTFNENVSSRFASLGWQTLYVKNGSSVSEIDKAIRKAKEEENKPTLIEIKTILGEGLTEQGKNVVHSGILNKEELALFKEKTNAGSIPFTILKEPASYIRDQVVNRGIKIYDDWKSTYEEYKKILRQDQINDIENLTFNNVSFDISNVDFSIDYDNKELLRDTNHKVMNILGANVNNFIGGSADLSFSTRTYLDEQGDLNSSNLLGKNISFGVREHLMGSVLNGLAASGFRPFGSTYLAYSDYLKPAIKMSTLMNLPVTYVFTHDSITVGSDGPVYHPYENLASLRAMPNLYVFRPADIKELVGTWNIIINNKTPSVVSIAKTEVKPEEGTNSREVARGAYIVSKEQTIINAIIIATGAEVQVAKSLQMKLLHEGIDVRVVSMPCMELFNAQSMTYKNEIIPNGVPIFVIEYGSSFGWEKFVMSSDYLFTVDNISVSASKDDILKYSGLDTESILEKIKSLLK